LVAYVFSLILHSMDKQFDLIGIGECLIELFEEAPHIYKQSVAGDVFNTLFYASRLGLKTGFISNFGSDDLTKNILEVMDREGINRSCTSISESKTNGVYLISTNHSGEPYYAFWRNDSAARETLQTIDIKKIEEYIGFSKYFHFSAIALAILKDREVLISLLMKLLDKVKITFDTNFRNGLWDDIGKLRDFIETASSFVDVLFVSKSDDENIFGSRTAGVAMKYYQQLGYKVIIYKQGSQDVIAWDTKTIIRVPTLKDIKVVDATAAGDAFNAGFISAQIRGENIENSIRNGNSCATFVIGRRGGLAEDFQMTKGMLKTND
jgi:2-dehydro-3-deoxygluconokinase